MEFEVFRSGEQRWFLPIKKLLTTIAIFVELVIQKLQHTHRTGMEITNRKLNRAVFDLYYIREIESG